MPNKRKHKINPKLLNDNNVLSDAVPAPQSRSLEICYSSPTSTSATTQSSSRPQSSQPTTQSIPSTSRQASVEAVHDEDDIACCNAGTPRNSSTILESVDDNDDNIYVAQHATDAQQVKEKETEEQLRQMMMSLVSLVFECYSLQNIYLCTVSSAVAKGLAFKRFTHSFSLKLKLAMLMVGNVTNLPVMPKIVRERGKMHAFSDITLIRRTKLRRRAFAHILLNTGVRRLLRNQRRPKI
jgi:hypothetical protein